MSHIAARHQARHLVIGKTVSRLLTTYYRGRDHPLKLRLWRYMRQISGYAPLTVASGEGRWITLYERDWPQSHILNRGAYEPEVWTALAQHVTQDEVVWDVGAHIGSFALAAAQDSRVRSVCAFEPDPLNLVALRRNLALNGNPALVYPVALSDTTERKTLIHGPATNSGMSTLAPSASTGMSQHTSVARPPLPTFEVECRTADDLVMQDAVPAPTLMKVDVEGWEYRVLVGASGLLQSATLKALVFESACGTNGRSEDKRLVSLLHQYNYSLSRIERPDGELRGVENYLAVHR